METRQLGGLTVPLFSLGTGTFGGANEVFKAWGSSDVAEATRLVDICLDAGVSMFDSADIYSAGMSEEILGQAVKGRRDKVLISTKGTFRAGTGLNDVGSSRQHLTAAVDASLQAARNRLHRPLPASWLRRPDAGRGDAGDARRSGSRRQDPLHRLLELFGLASDEVAGCFRPLRLAAVRCPPGVLLADRAGVRVGVDAAGARPEGWRGRMEPAWLGAPDRQDPSRAAAAGRQPAPQQDGRRYWPAGRGRVPLSRCGRDRRKLPQKMGKTVPQVALNWLSQRPSVSNIIIGARNEEQLRQNLGAIGWSLTGEQIAALDAASAKTLAYPYWHQRFFADRNPPPV